jgi:hypothetical protein
MSTMDVKHSVKEDLKDLKSSLGLKTLSDVVAYLLEQHAGGGEQNSESSDDGGPRAMDVEEDKTKKLPALLSFEILDKGDKPLRFFTGMNRECLNWTMQKTVAAVFFFFFILFEDTVGFL